MLRFFDRLNLTPPERRLVVIIVTIVIVVLNYWLVWPRFGDLQAVTAELNALDSKRERFEQEIARRPQYEAVLRKLQAEGSVLPAGEERIQFRSDMERLARDVGLYVPRWSEVLAERSSGSTTNAFFEAISLTLSQVTGTEAQFVAFLYRVGASNSTIRVKELNLVPGNVDARSQGSTNLIGTLKLVASVQKAPAPGQPAAGTAVPSPGVVRESAAPTATSRGVTNVSGAPHNLRSTNRLAGAGSRTNAYPIPVRVITGTNLTGPRSPTNASRR